MKAGEMLARIETDGDRMRQAVRRLADAADERERRLAIIDLGHAAAMWDLHLWRAGGAAGDAG